MKSLCNVFEEDIIYQNIHKYMCMYIKYMQYRFTIHNYMRNFSRGSYFKYLNT